MFNLRRLIVEYFRFSMKNGLFVSNRLKFDLLNTLFYDLSVYRKDRLLFFLEFTAKYRILPYFRGLLSSSFFHVCFIMNYLYHQIFRLIWRCAKGFVFMERTGLVLRLSGWIYYFIVHEHCIMFVFRAFR